MFCLLADEKLPKLKNKKYSDYKLDEEEWSILGLIKEVLAVWHVLFHDNIVTHTFKGASLCTGIILFRDGTDSMEDNSHSRMHSGPLGNNGCNAKVCTCLGWY